MASGFCSISFGRSFAFTFTFLHAICVDFTPNIQAPRDFSVNRKRKKRNNTKNVIQFKSIESRRCKQQIECNNNTRNRFNIHPLLIISLAFLNRFSVFSVLPKARLLCHLFICNVSVCSRGSFDLIALLHTVSFYFFISLSPSLWFPLRRFQTIISFKTQTCT